MLYVPSVYGIEFFEDIYKQVCYIEIFCKYTFNDSADW